MKFITLRNGDMIKADAIVALRKIDAVEVNKLIGTPGIPNRILIDYINGISERSLIIECRSKEDMEDQFNELKRLLIAISSDK